MVQGVASAASGAPPVTHRDLWSKLSGLPFQPVVRKLTAHLTADAAALRGLPEEFRLGNARADRFAGQAWAETPIRAKNQRVHCPTEKPQGDPEGPLHQQSNAQ